MLKKSEAGFTLIELMIVVVIISIVSISIVRGFARFNAHAEESRAQKEIIDLSLQLEKYRAENFTFKGFNKKTVTLPAGASGGEIRYTLSIVDTESKQDLTHQKSTGYSWAIKAESEDRTGNFNLLLNSYGERCKNLSAARVSFKDCGTALQGSEQW